MKPRDYAIDVLKEGGVRFDDDIGNGLLVQLLADFHDLPFGSRPRKNRARELLEAYMAFGPAALVKRCMCKADATSMSLNSIPQC